MVKYSLIKMGEDDMEQELIVKPILVYSVVKRKERTSWRGWGKILSEEDAKQERDRINKELAELKDKAEFPINILPISTIKSEDELDKITDIEKSDVILVYAAGGFINIFQEKLYRFLHKGKHLIFFLRHKSGPLYLWYEVLHPLFLRNSLDEVFKPDVSVKDVVVDDYEEILWRLRALYGLKNTIGRRVVVIGRPWGWGTYGEFFGPYNAKKIWKLDLITVTYEELGRRIKAAKNNPEYVDKARQLMETYLKEPGVKLATKEKFVLNAFILYLVFKDLLKEYDADVITVNECMTTIIPIADTTACLTLSVLNDEGYLAFCESDFVAIPAGILLHYISRKPVAIVDPTFPHHGIVTVAHCTAPRRLSGKGREPATIVTHYESDYGAAPKVWMKKGQVITVIDPDFFGKMWIGFRGTIIDVPSLPICRSQADIKIEGDWELLLDKMRGFHWVFVYGDYLKEFAYALRKVGIGWLDITNKGPSKS